MNTFLTYAISLVNIRRHIAMIKKIEDKTSVPLLTGRTFYEFVGADVYEALRYSMAESVLWMTEQAIDLNETMGRDTAFYAEDYQYLISMRDWAVKEVQHWFSDRLALIELAYQTEELGERTIPSSSSVTNESREALRELNLRKFYDCIDRL